jgi:hypothetical protein
MTQDKQTKAKKKEKKKKKEHNTAQKAKKMSNTDPLENRGRTQVLAKDKQFMLLIRHPP